MTVIIGEIYATSFYLKVDFNTYGIKFGNELYEEIVIIIIALVSAEFVRCLMLYERNIYEQ